MTKSFVTDYTFKKTVANDLSSAFSEQLESSSINPLQITITNDAGYFAHSSEQQDTFSTNLPETTVAGGTRVSANAKAIGMFLNCFEM